MNTLRFRLWPYAASCPLLLLLFAGSVRADAPAAPVQTPPRQASLFEALTTMPAASVNDGSVVLTAGADWVMPVPVSPDDEVVPTPQGIAARYGRTFQVFGPVLVLAPPTMTVLSTDPALAEVPISALAVQHPLPFLLGTLTAAQMQQLSGVGLGFADLSPDQQALLKAALPTPFQVVPKSAKQPSYTMDEASKTGPERVEIDARIAEEQKLYTLNTETVPPETVLSSLRLHGFLAPEFVFDGAGNSIGEGYSEDGFETTGTKKLVNGGRTDMFGSGNAPLQALLRGEVPNLPKPSDFDWNGSEMLRPVSLQGLKTVDDLTNRLAKATGLELYADPNYGRLSLTIRGDLKATQEPRNVMPALALCVCGTWRRVGPAYVLTNDVAGLGARQEFLHEMVQAWSNRLTEGGKAVGGHLAETDWLHALHFAPGDIGALSPTQIEQITQERSDNHGHLLWGDLPAPLQAGLRGQLTRHFDGDGMAAMEAVSKGIARSLTPDFNLGVTVNLRLGVSLPGTGVMTLGEPYRVQMPRPATPPSATVSEPPKAQVNSVTLDKPLRGVLCAPRTPDEARAVVAKLPKMGLNTLFLDVFTNGRAFFPNTVLPPADGKASGVLQAALEAAKAQHIPVYAVVDLLCWRKDGAAVHPQPWPARFAEDRTITGEAPDQMVRRELDQHTVRADFDRDLEMGAHGSQSWVSPLDPRVAASLPPLLHDLAAVKGLAGIALQDTAALGYLGVDYDFDEENIALGYTTENRLAFLRAYHTDPIDLSTTNENPQLFLPFEGSQSSFDATVPNFRTGGSGNAAAWNKLRNDADKALLASCYTALRSAAPALPLLMRERRNGANLDPWTEAKMINQIVSLDSMNHPYKNLSAASILCLPYNPYARTDPKFFSWRTQSYGMAGDDGKRAGGEVIDLVTDVAAGDLLDTLDRLNLFLKK